ncbi:type II toxin-antitoxin system ParD family antitoxin [Sandaracinobacteroides saxicola]|uniref:Type II toxin-antitoxin system ParD family antitoxin n=1 Tax=Sandaracinobacteroides saxicola TaxID=2759707 RepID=A0A7G5IF61_9SPHN|nr:type II toxin-antitoxin system ParD family antitoxin [Sandaracinobacteroides saxicola]QMW22003.1 type II toxin-antitoxin system ParD family antitoxin [Sandaracinobacteroides saxicola]
MASVTVSAEDEAWIAAQVRAGRARDAASLISALMERERADAAKLATLRAMVEEGRQSGISSRTIDDIFAGAMAKAGA